MKNWLLIILMGVLIFMVSHVINVVSIVYMKQQDVSAESIKIISETYVNSLDIYIDTPIEYSFVKYNNKLIAGENEILLGTFYKWNNTYFINVTIDLYRMTVSDLYETVIHETRHLIVQYLKDENIIDLTKYTEEIAEQENDYYNNLFDAGVYLLQQQQQ